MLIRIDHHLCWSVVNEWWICWAEGYMYDGNPVHIHTGRYPRGIDVSNFNWKLEYFVPEERFSGGGVQIWRPFVSYLLSIHVQTLNVTFWFFFRVRVDTDSNKAMIRKNLIHNFSLIHVFKGKTNIVKFNFVEKGGSRRRVPVVKTAES